MQGRHLLAKLRAHGEVAEWSKAHAWKVCIRQRIEGSNPSLSAIYTKMPPLRRRFCIDSQWGMRAAGSTKRIAFGIERRRREARRAKTAHRLFWIFPPSPPLNKKATERVAFLLSLSDGRRPA